MSVKISGLDNLTQKIDRMIDDLSPVAGEVYSAGAVQNGRRYEHYVQSSRYQAAVHQGRWQTDTDVAKANEQRALEEVNAEIRRIMSGRGDMRRALQRILSQIRDDMRDYPPAPAGSRYVRTFTLKNSWSTRYL